MPLREEITKQNKNMAKNKRNNNKNICMLKEEHIQIEKSGKYDNIVAQQR